MRESPETEPGGEARGEPSEPSPPARSIKLPDARRLTKQARVGAKRVVLRQVPGGARYAFRVDLAAMLLAGLYTGAVFPFVNVIAREDLNATPHILAFMAAAPFLGNLMALFWARAMEGKRKVPFVMWSHLGARFSILLAFFAHGAWPFAMVISGAQIIGTVATPAYAAIIKDVYPESQRGRILSITRAAIVLAQIFSTFLVGWLFGFTDYHTIFPLAALVGIAAALVFSRIQPDEPAVTWVGMRNETDPPTSPGAFGKVKDTAAFIWSTLGILKTDHAYRWFAMSVFVYGFGNLLVLPVMPIIQVNELHITLWQVSLFTVATQIVMAGAFFYWGRFVDLRSPQLAVVVNILINTSIPLVYIVAGTVLPANAWVLLPAFMISGIVGAGIDLSYFSALLTFARESDVSRYQALQSFLVGIRGSIAPFIGGGMAQAFLDRGINLRWIFLISLGFILVGAWMQVVAMRRQRERLLILDRG